MTTTPRKWCSPTALVLLLAACGGRGAEGTTSPVPDQGPPDAGAPVEPPPPVPVTDVPPGGQDGMPGETPEPVPCEAEAAQAEAAQAEPAPGSTPRPGPPGEGPLCQRHREELMSPPASPRPPIDCGRVDRIVYWRWSATDGCRDVTRLSLRRGGDMALERSDPAAAPPACGPPSSLERSIDPAEAAAAIQTACKSFNEQYDPGAGLGCPAGSRLVEFFDGNVKSGRTEALPCGSRTMSGALERLDRLLQGF